MQNKYIFGGGISGLIFKYYNPNYVLITPDIGGQLKKHKNILMTFYIHSTKETKKLLNDLKIKYKEKRLRIYYYYKNKILESLNNKLRIKFIKNKLCEYDYDSNSVDVNDLNLSTQSNYLDILDCDINELIKKLTPKEYIYGVIKLINNNRKFFVYQDENKNLVKLNYDKIVSTIPAQIFFNMLYNYKNDYHFNYLPTTFVLSDTKPKFMDDNSIYYICDDNLIYNRIQPYSNNYVYEITGLPDKKEIKKILNIIELEQRYIGLIKSEDVDDFKHIKFLGRMAQWNHSIKVQDIIIKSKKIKENEQKKVV